MNFLTKKYGYKNNNKNVVSKKVRSTTTIMVMALLSVTAMSCKDTKKKNEHDGKAHSEMNDPIQQEAKASFYDAKMAAAYQHYLHVMTALINSDTSEAQSGAKLIIENTNDEALKSAVSAITNTDDIETQRKAFSEVTLLIEPKLKNALSSGKIYKQFCPMAFNNTGGYWLSDKNKIQNPYYGKRMLKCGKVTETIVKP